jgi:hypothetical protein
VDRTCTRDGLTYYEADERCDADADAEAEVKTDETDDAESDARPEPAEPDEVELMDQPVGREGPLE